MKRYFTLLVLLIIYSCKQTTDKKGIITDKEEIVDTIKQYTASRLYSKSVGDTFSISINLPKGYNKLQQRNYPIVYLLDANIYFDILATTLNKYADLGLAPDVILVGIGYKDFQAMDSLRNRDDTYPTAIPEYEMSISGGADKFLAFINNELIPQMDKKYKTDTSRRILMGHSLGGYFTAYAMLQDLQGNSKGFSSYIAASPSIHFNKYYLLNRFEEIKVQSGSRKIKAYFTFGGLEDDEDKDDPGMMKNKDVLSQLSTLFSNKHSNQLIFKSDMFSNLGHMDTQMPTFIKGLQWAVSDNR